MVAGAAGLSRRNVLTGRLHRRIVHISSAVITAFPERCRELADRLNAYPGTEVHRIEHSKIVIVMEAESTGEIGSRMASIALLDGVISANLVFEQIEEFDDAGG